MARYVATEPADPPSASLSTFVRKSIAKFFEAPRRSMPCF